jgi:hypothetical protein
MPQNPTATGDKISTVTTGWKELAPGASFAGMTLEQFMASVQPSLDARTKIEDLLTQLEAARVARDNADIASMEDLLNVVNSVRGNPNYGENSALYASFGYVRKDARNSGLTRKSDQPQPLLKAA